MNTFFLIVNVFHLDACVIHRWRADRAVPARISRETAFCGADVPGTQGFHFLGG